MFRCHGGRLQRQQMFRYFKGMLGRFVQGMQHC